MAYIGRQLARGENRIFDDISSSFNGSTTVFNLTVSSVATSTATPYQLFVSLGGVMQKPGVDFTTAGNQITFTTAPAAGLSCWIMIQGDAIDAASVSDGSVTPSKISGSGDFAFPADIRLKDSDGSHYVGFEAPATVSTNKVWTLPAADGSANQYLKTNGSGVLSWGSDANAPEGTSVLSTGESGTSKYLRTDGDGTCSWQTVAGGAWEVIATSDFNASAGGNFGAYAINQGWDNTEYRQIKVVFADVGNTGGARGLSCRIFAGSNNTNGTLMNQTAYKWSEYSREYGNTTENAYGNTEAVWRFSNNTKGYGWSGEIIFPLKYNAQTENYPNAWYTLSHSAKHVRGAMIYDGSNANTQFVTGVQLMEPSDDTWNFGKIIFMGLKV
jgi:hypothetical protein